LFSHAPFKDRSFAIRGGRFKKPGSRPSSAADDRDGRKSQAGGLYDKIEKKIQNDILYGL